MCVFMRNSAIDCFFWATAARQTCHSSDGRSKQEHSRCWRMRKTIIAEADEQMMCWIKMHQSSLLVRVKRANVRTCKIMNFQWESAHLRNVLNYCSQLCVLFDTTSPFSRSKMATDQIHFDLLIRNRFHNCMSSYMLYSSIFFYQSIT